MLGHIKMGCFTARLIFRVAVPFCITNSNCSASLSALGIISIFYFSHSNWYVVVFHGGFNFYFSSE